ncbi:hypothetical protein [Nocardia sp. NPDC057440]|uniref:hypothetical protein n=1 Tax=Nocardia sp. NPDC057440 TaxID=3346134 RepID=UPI003671185E
MAQKKKPKAKKLLKTLELERDEFRARLERIYTWNQETLGRHSAFLSGELKNLVLNEKDQPQIGFH